MADNKLYTLDEKLLDAIQKENSGDYRPIYNILETKSQRSGKDKSKDRFPQVLAGVIPFLCPF